MKEKIRVLIMKEHMAEVWSPVEGVLIMKCSYSSSIITRTCKALVFRKNILILNIIKEGEIPSQMPLNKVSIWS